MKKIVLGFGLLFLALLGMNGAIAQTTSEITIEGAAEPADGAKISVNKEEHDYGTIEKGANGECVFTITNTGNAPLIISYCKPSCGCTIPQWSKDPIPPGGKTEIVVKYDTNREGPFTKNVTITSNAVNTPSKVIRIKGKVNAKPVGGAPVNTGSPVMN
jgi:hypothetical protein